MLEFGLIVSLMIATPGIGMLSVIGVALYVKERKSKQ